MDGNAEALPPSVPVVESKNLKLSPGDRIFFTDKVRRVRALWSIGRSVGRSVSLVSRSVGLLIVRSVCWSVDCSVGLLFLSVG